MKILLTLGHQASGFENVHNVLVGAGMAGALPAKRNNLSPHQLVAKLMAACNAQTGELSQLSPGKLWSDLLADLLLTNLEQPIWGWADPLLIRLTGWLADYEPEIRFVLVFASPEMTLANELGGKLANEKEISGCLKEWSDYNEELLRFYYRNRDRCVLVSATSVLNAPERLLTQINNQFAVALNGQMTPPYALNAVAAVTAVLAKHLCAERQEIQALEQELQAATSIDVDVDAEASALLTNAWASFSELQAEGARRVSDLQADLKAAQDAQSNIAAEHQNQLEQLSQGKAEAEKKLSELQGKFETAQKSAAQQAERNRVLEQELKQSKINASKSDELEKLKRENADQAQENELLLLQLHQVQEELEHYFLQCQELKGGGGQSGKIAYPLRGISVDLRDEIPGDNWYYAEIDGRWAGPGLTSTLQLPRMEDGQYQVDLDVVDAMAPEILDTMELLINEQPIVWERLAEDYPALLRARFTTQATSNSKYWTLAFKFKHNISPKDHGSDDDRQLAIRLRSVTLLRCDD